MAPPSLKEMVIRAATRGVSTITGFADLPYELVKPILKKVDSPQQLHEIEVNSPHLADETAELWRAFIARDIPNWKDKIFEPKNPRSWWKVYRKMVRAEKDAQQASEDALRLSLQSLGDQRAKSQINLISRALPHPKGGGASSRGRLSLFDTTPRSPSLKNAKTGSEAMAAIRKQSAQAQREKGLSKSVHQPSRSLLDARRQILQAPDSMLREQGKLPVDQRPDLSTVRTAWEGYLPSSGTRIIAPSTTLTRQQKAANAVINRERVEKEARLRALTSMESSSHNPANKTYSPGPTQPHTEELLSSDQKARPRLGTASVRPEKTEPSHTQRRAQYSDDYAENTSPKPASSFKSSGLSGVSGQLTSGAKKRHLPGSVFMPGKRQKT